MPSFVFLEANAYPISYFPDTHSDNLLPALARKLSFLGYDWIRLISVPVKSVAYSQAGNDAAACSGVRGADFCCCSLTLLIMMLYSAPLVYIQQLPGHVTDSRRITVLCLPESGAATQPSPRKKANDRLNAI